MQFYNSFGHNRKKYNMFKYRERHLLALKDNFRKIVITADAYQTENIAGIETWNIRKFLLDF